MVFDLNTWYYINPRGQRHMIIINSIDKIYWYILWEIEGWHLNYVSHCCLFHLQMFRLHGTFCSPKPPGTHLFVFYLKGPGLWVFCIKLFFIPLGFHFEQYNCNTKISIFNHYSKTDANLHFYNNNYNSKNRMCHLAKPKYKGPSLSKKFADDLQFLNLT